MEMEYVEISVADATEWSDLETGRVAAARHTAYRAAQGVDAASWAEDLAESAANGGLTRKMVQAVRVGGQPALRVGDVVYVAESKARAAVSLHYELRVAERALRALRSIQRGMEHSAIAVLSHDVYRRRQLLLAELDQ